MLNGGIGRIPMLPRSIGIIILIVVLVGVGWFAWSTSRRTPALTFVVPDGYAGFLVTRWECPRGESLA